MSVICVFSFFLLILNIRLDRVGWREDWVWKCPILFRKELGWSIPKKMVLGKKTLFLQWSICHRVYLQIGFMACYETSAIACCMQSIASLVFWLKIMATMPYFLVLWLASRLMRFFIDIFHLFSPISRWVFEFFFLLYLT
jgi:hypothetical protein